MISNESVTSPNYQKEDQMMVNTNTKSGEGAFAMIQANPTIITQSQWKTSEKRHSSSESYRPSCSNSFGILEEGGDKNCSQEQFGIKCLEDGRKSRNANLPKFLKNDFVMEY